MKTQSFTTIVLAAAALAFTACSKAQQPAPPSPPTPATPPATNVTPAPDAKPTEPAAAVVAPTPVDPFGEMNAALEHATPAKHDGLSAVQTRMDRIIDDQVGAWKSAGNNVTLAADEKLDNATEDFAEKLRLLTLATPETWETAKHNTELSLQEVRSAYTAVMTAPDAK